jgi:hypothetical protein
MTITRAADTAGIRPVFIANKNPPLKATLPKRLSTYEIVLQTTVLTLQGPLIVVPQARAGKASLISGYACLHNEMRSLFNQRIYQCLNSEYKHLFLCS